MQEALSSGSGTITNSLFIVGMSFESLDGCLFLDRCFVDFSGMSGIGNVTATNLTLGENHSNAYNRGFVSGMLPRERFGPATRFRERESQFAAEIWLRIVCTGFCDEKEMMRGQADLPVRFGLCTGA
jgi:hypothetical protein